MTKRITTDKEVKNSEIFTADYESLKKLNREKSEKPSKYSWQRKQSLDISTLPDGENILIYNTTPGEFHVPPKSFNPHDNNDSDIIKFTVGEIKAFSKEEINNSQFMACFNANKLKIVNEEEAVKITKAQEKEASKSKSQEKVGLALSGLPNKLRPAMMYIAECEDLDELHAYADIEEREAVQAAIEERIGELEGE